MEIIDLKKIANMIKKNEYVIALLLSFALVYLFMYATGVINSGYHLIDDHDYYSIKDSLDNDGFIMTLNNTIRDDLTIRYRPSFIFIKVLCVYLVGTNMLLWHVIRTAEASFCFFLSYTVARTRKSPVILSMLLGFMILYGTQSPFLWRLGPQELLGTNFFLILLIFIDLYQKSRSRVILILLSVFTVFFSGTKESFLILVPFILLYGLYSYVNQFCVSITLSSIKRFIKANLFYIIFSIGVFTLSIAYILFNVGTNEIGYGGVDLSFTLEDYYQKIVYTLTYDTLIIYNVLSFFLILLGVIYTVIVKKTNKISKTYSVRNYIYGIILCLYIMWSQLFLYAKSGMFERYYIPYFFTVYFLIIITYNYITANNLSCYLEVVSVSIFCVVLFFNCDVFDAAKMYAADGSNITDILDNVSKMCEQNKDVSIGIALEYESDFSSGLYLEENTDTTINSFCLYDNNNEIYSCLDGYEKNELNDYYFSDWENANYEKVDEIEIFITKTGNNIIPDVLDKYSILDEYSLISNQIYSAYVKNNLLQ